MAAAATEWAQCPRPSDWPREARSWIVCEIFHVLNMATSRNFPKHWVAKESTSAGQTACGPRVHDLWLVIKEQMKRSGGGGSEGVPASPS